jgi:hypothetical protein
LRNDFGDTLRLYYREAAADTILLGRDTTFTDTITVSAAELEDASVLPLRTVQQTRGRVNPGEGLRLLFNRPIEAVDPARIRLYRDTLPTPVPFTLRIDSVYPAELQISAGWQEAPYRLEVLPEAVTDWYGTYNPDTLGGTVNLDARENYGDLTVHLLNLNGTVSYILRLINEEGEVILGTRRYIQDSFEYTARYRSLEADTYRLELIYDSNNNGRFDVGDLRFLQQPEVVRRFTIEPLRANWEVEKVIDLENN